MSVNLIWLDNTTELIFKHEVYGRERGQRRRRSHGQRSALLNVSRGTERHTQMNTTAQGQLQHSYDAYAIGFY